MLFALLLFKNKIKFGLYVKTRKKNPSQKSNANYLFTIQRLSTGISRNMNIKKIKSIQYRTNSFLPHFDDFSKYRLYYCKESTGIVTHYLLFMLKKI